MNDDEFERGCLAFQTHMTRFAEVHRRELSATQAEVLIELERQESWRRFVGAAADVLQAPAV